MKKVLWRNDVRSILIEPEEIEEKVEFINDNCFITDITSNEADEEKLTKKIMEWKEGQEKELGEEIDINDDLIKCFLENEGFNSDVRYSYEYEDQRDCIVWNKYNEEFDNLEDYETVKTYEHLNSQTNWETIVLRDEWDTEIELEVNEDSEKSLDIWDGNNWSTRSRFNHQYFYKINEIDNEEVENMYLLIEYDQYQGNLVKGIIMEKEELIEHIKNLGDRDPEDYELEN